MKDEGKVLFHNSKFILHNHQEDGGNMEKEMLPEDRGVKLRRIIEMDKSALPPDGGEEFNRLIFATSPYLLQHAGNPVDWYQWGEDAFAKARGENKPIFLSVGYAT